jgi:uncharacterized glyoxalase superfamily protein PhnB
MNANRPKLDDTAEFAAPPHLRGEAVTVSLTVKDLSKSVAWYVDVAGFQLGDRVEHQGKLRAASVTAGQVHLRLNQDDGAKGWSRTKGEGFSITITTRQRVDDIAKRIVAMGGTLVSEPADMPWGARVFRVVDPDGYKLSISSVRAG